MVLVLLHGLFEIFFLYFLFSLPLFSYSSLLLFLPLFFYSFKFSLIFVFSFIIFSLSSLFPHSFFPLISFIISLSLPLHSFPSPLFSFYISLFSSSSLFYFLNASSVPLIGHNYKVWKTLTQVRAFILHLRKPKLIEMEFPKITCYVLVVNRVRFRM